MSRSYQEGPETKAALQRAELMYERFSGTAEKKLTGRRRLRVTAWRAVGGVVLAFLAVKAGGAYFASQRAAEYEQSVERLKVARQALVESEGTESIRLAAELAVDGIRDSDERLTADLHCVLGHAYYRLEEFDKAVGVLQAGLRTADADAAGCLYAHMGVVLLETDRAEAASRATETALRLREQGASYDPRQLAESLNNLGVYRGMAGDLESSEDYLRRSITLRQPLDGGMSLELAESYANLAQMLRHAGRLGEARDYIEQSIGIRATRLSEDAPILGRSRQTLATVYLESGEAEKAIEQYDRVVDVFTRTIGSEHVDMARPEYGLARAYLALGDRQQAEEHARRAAELYEGALNRTHRRTAEALALLGEIQGGAEGRALIEEAYASMLAAVGPDHPKTKDVLAKRERV